MQMLFSFIGGVIFASAVLYPLMSLMLKQNNKYSEYIMHHKDATAYHATKPKKNLTAEETKAQEKKREKDRLYREMSMSGVVDDETMEAFGIREGVNA